MPWRGRSGSARGRCSGCERSWRGRRSSALRPPGLLPETDLLSWLRTHPEPRDVGLDDHHDQHAVVSRIGNEAGSHCQSPRKFLAPGSASGSPASYASGEHHPRWESEMRPGAGREGRLRSAWKPSCWLPWSGPTRRSIFPMTRRERGAGRASRRGCDRCSSPRLAALPGTPRGGSRAGADRACCSPRSRRIQRQC
jgi:hypothetical protein